MSEPTAERTGGTLGFIIQRNIQHFEKQLRSETDAVQCGMLRQLLSEELAKLARLQKPPEDASRRASTKLPQ